MENLMINKYYIKGKIDNYIKPIVKKNLRLYCLCRILKNINNIEFFKQIDLIYRDSNKISMMEFGSENKDTNILLIARSAKNVGMGGFFRYTLYGLFEAEKLGFSPVVHYKECPYKDDTYEENTKNPFEYYFEQPTKISLYDTYNSSRVFIFEGVHINRIEKEFGNTNPELVASYIVKDEYLKSLGKVVKKHIKLNQKTRKFIQQSIDELFPSDWKTKGVLAIHVRGTDFA